MKHEWRKHEKNLYLAKSHPQLLEVPVFKFLSIKGRGNPNTQDFSLKVATLYGGAYGLKMLPKKNIHPKGYYDYTVYPLEGLWDLSEEGRLKANLDKNELVYTLMIRQPDFIEDEHLDFVKENLQKKHPEMESQALELITLHEGLCVQALHVGSYDDEPATFDKMKQYISEHDLQIKSLVHREIYLSDPRKTQEDKLKTVLRYQVYKT